jgi:Reverse transcriptase (RNA-dependent DNA polymerase)
VINDSVFRIVIILQIMWKLHSVIMDVETAFLHGDLDEDIYMDAPKGTDLKPWQCVKLDKALYGLVQAARQFYLKFANILTKMGFTTSYADPCLFHRQTTKGFVIMVIHIDDCYVIGHRKALRDLVDELYSHGLKVKCSLSASDYLSCDICVDTEQQCAWIGQTTLLKKMLTKFKPQLAQMPNFVYKTPGTPGQALDKQLDDIGTLSPPEQTLFRSGVGTLLQFANKTRPDLANPVRDLSTFMDKATPAALKEIFRIMKYVSNTPEMGLKLQPKFDASNLKNWTLKLYSDSDWVASKIDRKSITGFVLFLQDAPILWKSQSQRTVSLSSTEAEYYAMSEATKEIKFIV